MANPGDLRFYHGDGSPADTLIADATGGPSASQAYVHVEIDLGDGTSIGELLGGLQHYPTPDEPAGRVTLWPTSAHTDPATLAAALLWARDEATQRLGYGWEDIANAGLRVLAPGAPAIAEANAWDCSDFVTRFLLQARVALPFALASEPHCVTPEGLALALGVR